MDRSGKVLNPSQDPNFTKDQALYMYKIMMQLNEMDRILYDAQRQASDEHLTPNNLVEKIKSLFLKKRRSDFGFILGFDHHSFSIINK